MHNSNLCGQSFSTANTHQSHQPTLHRQLQFASCQTSISVARRSFQYLNQEPGCFLASRIFLLPTISYAAILSIDLVQIADRIGISVITPSTSSASDDIHPREQESEDKNDETEIETSMNGHRTTKTNPITLWAYASPGGTNRSPLFHFLWSTWPGSAC